MESSLERVARWRAETPLVAAKRTHLNNAGAAATPEPVLRRIGEHLRLEAELGGYEAAAAVAGDVASVYERIATLIGAAPRNVALVENATAAYAQALSAFDFEPGDVVLTTRHDYASNILMFLSLRRRRGVEIVYAEDLPAGGADPESVRSLIARRRPALVAVTLVPTNSGLVQRAGEIGAICREHDVPYLVDACQAIGQTPVSWPALGCDYLCATGRKFLRGPRGTGFLVVSDRELERRRAPLFVDLHGARWLEADELALRDDARRFENWEFAYALVLGLGEAVRYLLEQGVERTTARAAELGALARRRLSELDRVRALDRGERLAAIAVFALDGAVAGDVVLELRRRGINTSALDRASALFDMDRAGVSSALRVSPHYYNTEEEIEHLAAALAEILEDAA